MYLRTALALTLALLPVGASAEQIDQARTASTVPSLIQQRNSALDALALCGGDMQALQQKLKDAEAALKAKTEELEKMKATAKE